MVFLLVLVDQQGLFYAQSKLNLCEQFFCRWSLFFCLNHFGRGMHFFTRMRILWFWAALALGGCGSDSDPIESPQSVPPARGASLSRERPADPLPPPVLPLADPSKGEWSGLVSLPIVPAAAAQLPNGKVLFWSSSGKFSVGAGGGTFTSEWDPASGEVTERRVTETGHDMYCAGIIHLSDSSLLVSGGDQSEKTSLYDPGSARWSSGPLLTAPRCHAANTILANGEVLTAGGGYGGASADQYAEVWNSASGWRRLSHLTFELSSNEGGVGLNAAEQHPWMLTAPHGMVLRAGPGPAMHWIDPRGRGKLNWATLRGDDDLTQQGSVALFEVGKALKVGGMAGRQNEPGSRAAYLIDMNTGLSARKLAPMAYPRVNAHSVVLPNGQVMIIGGQTAHRPLSDDLAVLPGELWDPVTERFTTLAPMAVARNDNSVAMLLPDARVLTAGGGLCGSGCGANHPDAQIYTPYYLLNPDGTSAQRPVIKNAPTKASHGTGIQVELDSAVVAFALVRLSAVSHTVNHGQRRIPLRFSVAGEGRYQVDLPSNPSVILPGSYMLFAMNERGVPSVAHMMHINGTEAPQLALIDSQISSVGSPVRLAVEASSPKKGELRFSARGLPEGLSIHPETGLISGLPSHPGQFVSIISVSNSIAATSTQVLWAVQDGGPEEVNFVRLVALSAMDGGPAASIAELNLLDAQGRVMPRGGWTAMASSEETQDPGRAAQALDGDPKTAWYSQYSNVTKQHPHELVIKLGAPRIVTGFKYLPRIDLPEGAIGQWRFDTSRDGVNWHEMGRGHFQDFGSQVSERTVYFNNLSQNQPALQSSTEFGAVASRAVDGNINGDFFKSLSVSHTQADEQGWWQVDLGSEKSLAAIRWWNRTDCCVDRWAKWHVLVSVRDMSDRGLDDLLADTSVWHTKITGIVGPQWTVPARTAGRYVRIQRDRSGPLALAEVQVFGTPVNQPPILAQLPDQNWVLGRQHAVLLSGSDPDGEVLSFSATNLPLGVEINPVSGTISGRPVETGDFAVTVRATDPRGASSSLQVAWSVKPAPVTLALTESPPLRVGQERVFEAGIAAADGLRFQWNFGDGTPPVGPTAATRQTHRFSLAGIYQVEVQALSPSGQVLGLRRHAQAVFERPTDQIPSRSSSLAWEDRPGASSRIWMANPDHHSVTVFDAGTQRREAEIPAGESPRTLAIAPDRRVWVVNQRSDSISVIDPVTLTVVQHIELPRASQPYGLVFAPDGLAAYVVLAATGQLLKLDPGSGATLASVSAGIHARHVAVNHNSTQVFVSRFITPPLPGEATAQVQTRSAAGMMGGELLLIDAEPFQIRQTIVLAHSDETDSEKRGRGVPNYLGPLVISPDGYSAWVPSKQDNIKRGILRDAQALVPNNTIRAISSRINLTTLTEDLAGRVSYPQSGWASDAVFHPSGAYLFVALQTSREIAVTDPVGKVELFRFDTGRAPEGVMVSPDGLQLYVNNFMDRQLAIYDLSPLVNWGEHRVPLLKAISSVASEKLAPEVFWGKQLFYDAKDPRLAGDASLSCASCHMDGAHDGRTWDFTGFGEGLRNTPALRGRGAGQGMLNWTDRFDEIHDFEEQIRTLAGGKGLMSDEAFYSGTRHLPLGDKKAGVSAELDALAAYVASLSQSDPSPHRSAGGALSAEGLKGKTVFLNHCASCHGGPAFGDRSGQGLHNIGTLKSSSGQRLGTVLGGLATPSLRGVWSSAPYLHDGSAPTIEAAVEAHLGLNLLASELASVSAYVQQIGPEEPAAPLTRSAGTGLSAAYFSNLDFSGVPALVRTEAVHADWAQGSPLGGILKGAASVRWTGLIQAPASGVFILQALSDESVRVWVDGQQVIASKKTASKGRDQSPPLRWVAGRPYSMVIEYQNRVASGRIDLRWKPPGASEFVRVPTAQLFPVIRRASANLARGKRVSQSSTDLGGEAHRAVDGQTRGVYAQGSVAQTLRGPQSWWQVDLGSIRHIDAIRLWPRTDCCADRMSDMEVWVSDADMSGRSLSSLLADPSLRRWPVWARWAAPGNPLDVEVSSRGRFVRIVKKLKGPLALAEVEVFGK